MLWVQRENYVGPFIDGFIWRHGGYICVPKQLNGGHTCALNESYGTLDHSY